MGRRAESVGSKVLRMRGEGSFEGLWKPRAID